MVIEILSPELEKEEEVVAELQKLGIRYISRLNDTSPNQHYPPAKLIVDIVCQPSARVRNALVSLFLAQPGYAGYVQESLTLTNNRQGIAIKFFYTAAVLLQKKLRSGAVMLLPDLFSSEIGISTASAENGLRELGRKHQEVSGLHINWQGTYENAARHLFRQWELEKVWKK